VHSKRTIHVGRKPSLDSAPTTLATFFILWPCSLIWSMTLTFVTGPDSVKMNQHAKYLCQKSFISSKVVFRYKDTHTHRTDCFTRTTKLTGNNYTSHVKTDNFLPIRLISIICCTCLTRDPLICQSCEIKCQASSTSVIGEGVLFCWQTVRIRASAARRSIVAQPTTQTCYSMPYSKYRNIVAYNRDRFPSPPPFSTALVTIMTGF